jgi:hypothetical protein
MTKLHLTGDRCQCAACHQYFNSVRSFDQHRIGRFSPPLRRCFTPDQMTASGMRRNASGFWLTRNFGSRDSRWTHGGGDPGGNEPLPPVEAAAIAPTPSAPG